MEQLILDLDETTEQFKLARDEAITELYLGGYIDQDEYITLICGGSDD